MIESVGELEREVNFGSGICRELAANYSGRSLGIIVVQLLGGRLYFCTGLLAVGQKHASIRFSWTMREMIKNGESFSRWPVQ